MQSKQVKRLAERIRRKREKQNRSGVLTVWREVCLSVKPAILRADGKPDAALAFKIAYQNYEPDLKIQKRLGLREHCNKCGRSFRTPSTRKPAQKSAARRWWESLTRVYQEILLEELYRNEVHPSH